MERRPGQARAVRIAVASLVAASAIHPVLDRRLDTLSARCEARRQRGCLSRIHLPDQKLSVLSTQNGKGGVPRNRAGRKRAPGPRQIEADVAGEVVRVPHQRLGRILVEARDVPREVGFPIRLSFRDVGVASDPHVHAKLRHAGAEQLERSRRRLPVPAAQEPCATEQPDVELRESASAALRVLGEGRKPASADLAHCVEEERDPCEHT